MKSPNRTARPSRITLGCVALALASLAARESHAQETLLPVFEIYGDRQASRPRRPREPGVHLRAGLGFLSAGFAFNTNNHLVPGAGFSGHLGIQFNRLIGLYLAARYHTVIVLHEGEIDAILDFTLRDRVQVGGGIGFFATATSYNGATGVTFPFHVAMTPVLFVAEDGRRSGLHLTIDLAPGVTPSAPAYTCGYYYSASCGPFFAFTAAVGLGWEWY